MALKTLLEIADDMGSASVGEDVFVNGVASQKVPFLCVRCFVSFLTGLGLDTFQAQLCFIIL